jgi:hypothetical protein
MTLSTDDKLNIVNQKIRNVEYSKYSVELELRLEGASGNSDAAVVTDLNTQISNLDAKMSILEAEKTLLEG